MKKFLSLFLSVMLLFALVPTFNVAAAKELTFAVGNAKGKVGETVEIKITIENNPGIIGLMIDVNYDDSALKLKNYEEKDFKGVQYSPITRVPFRVRWLDPLNKDNNHTNGVLVTLEFEVLDTAPNGKSEITLSCDDPQEMFNAAFEDIAFGFENGYVDIKNSNPPKQPATSSQSSKPTQSNTSSQVTVDEEKSNSSSTQASSESEGDSPDNTYEQVVDKVLNSSSGAQNSDSDKISNNASGDEIINTDGETEIGANTETDTDADNIDEKDDTNTDNIDSQNKWLIWVVVAAIVVLGGAFAVVIIKSKKDKE